MVRNNQWKTFETVHKLTKLSNLYNIDRLYDWTNHIICWSYHLDLSKKLDNRSSISFLLLSVILSGILLLLKKWLKSLLPSEISSIFLWPGSKNPSIVSTAYLLCIGIRSSTESYNEIFVQYYSITNIST